MSSLSPPSRDLIDAARDGDALGDDDRRRMRDSILAQVGVGAVAAATAATAKAATAATATATTAKAAKAATAATAAGAANAAVGSGALSLLKLGVGAALATALGLGAVSMMTSEEPPASSSAPVAAPAERAPLTDPALQHASDAPSDEPEPAPLEEIADPGPPAAIPEARAPVRPDRERTLAEETALLQRAQAEMKAGNDEAALELLDAHQRRFAHGAMAEEREAARVLALCASGRVSEGRAAAATFVTRFPRSPHKSRVLAACP